MGAFKYAVIGAAFEVLSLPGIARLVRACSRSKGVIFTLHRVLPGPPAEFSPNAILQITPQFLDETIRRVRALGIDIVSLDEAIRRLKSPEKTRRFAVFTFDDGYRDNLEYALPVLRAHNCPFTLYVPTALVDGVGEVWWQALEDIIAKVDTIEMGQGAEAERFDTSTLAGKHAAYDVIYWRMRKMPEPDRVTLIRDLASRYGLNLNQHCRQLIMDWAELKTFADEPLCTIAAHTVHHCELAKLDKDHAAGEIDQSIRIIHVQCGRKPDHLSFPIGGPASAGPREFELARDLGLHSAVTTRPGGLYADSDLCALPRVSLNGLFQKPRYVNVFATGAIFTIMGRLTG
jgi:peptidoglycan/xylan/chitin deacetylase (PgdA/CDA1 family)